MRENWNCMFSSFIRLLLEQAQEHDMRVLHFELLRIAQQMLLFRHIYTMRAIQDIYMRALVLFELSLRWDEHTRHRFEQVALYWIISLLRATTFKWKGWAINTISCRDRILIQYVLGQYIVATLLVRYSYNPGHELILLLYFLDTLHMALLRLSFVCKHLRDHSMLLLQPDDTFWQMSVQSLTLDNLFIQIQIQDFIESPLILCEPSLVVRSVLDGPLLDMM